MGQQYPYFTRWVKTFVLVPHIYGDKDILLLYVITKTLNMSNKEWNLV